MNFDRPITMKEIASDVQDIGAALIFMGGAIIFSSFDPGPVRDIGTTFYVASFFYCFYWTFVEKYKHGS